MAFEMLTVFRADLSDLDSKAAMARAITAGTAKAMTGSLENVGQGFKSLSVGMDSIAKSGAAPAMQQVAAAAQEEARSISVAALSTKDLGLQKASLLAQLKNVQDSIRSETKILADAQAAVQQYGTGQKALNQAYEESRQKLGGLIAAQTGLKGALSETDAALKKTQTQTQETSKSFDGLKSGMQAASQGMLMGGAALVALGVGFAALVKQGSDVQQVLVHVAGNTSMGAEEFANLQKVVLTMGATMPVAMDDIAKAYMQAANFGFQMSDATRVVEAGLKSAVATGANAEGVVRALSIAMHIFGIDSSDTAKAMDVLHLAAARGGQTLEQFSAASAKVFAVAHAMGVSFVDISAAFSAMTRAGFSAAQSATALSGAIFKIVNPSKGAHDELVRLSKATGVDLVSDFTRSGLAAKGLSGVLDDIHKAVGNNTDEILKFLPAQRGAIAAIVLTTTAAADYKKNLEELNDVIAGKLTPTQQDYERAVNTVGSQITILGNQFQVFGFELLTAIGPSLITSLKSLNEVGLTVIGFLSQMPPTIALATAAFLTAAGVVGTVSVALGGLIFVLGGPVTLAVIGLGVIIGTFAAAVATNFGGITTAIKAWAGNTHINFVQVAGTVGSMLDAVSIFARTGIGFFDAVGTAIVAFVRLVIGAYPAIEGLGRTLIGLAAADVGAITAGLSQMGAAIKSGVVDALSQVGAEGRRELARIQADVENVNGKYKKLFTSAAENAGSFGKSLGDLASKGLTAWKNMEDGLDHLGDKSGKTHKKIKDDTEKVVAAQLGLVNDWLKSTSQQIEISEAAWKLVPNAAKAALLDQAATFHKNIEEVQAWRAQQLAAALTTGDAWAAAALVLQKMADSITAKFAEMTAKAKDVKVGQILHDELAPVVTDLLARAKALAEDGVGRLTSALDQMISPTKQWSDALKPIPAQLLDTSGGMDNLIIKMKAATPEVIQLAAAIKNFLTSDKDFLNAQAIVAAQKQIDDSIKVTIATWEEYARIQGKTGQQIIDEVIPHLKQLGAEGEKAAIQLQKGFDQVSFDALSKKVNNAVRGITEIFTLIPGKFGDMAKEIERTVNTIDKILKNLHAVFNNIPSSLGDAIAKVVSIFKGGASQIDTISSSIGGLIIKNLTPGQKLVESALDDMLGPVTAKAAEVGKGIAEGVGEGFRKNIGGIIAAITTAVVLLVSLFHKSALQKAQEAAALQKAKDDITLSQQAALQAIEATKQSVLESAGKIRDLLESIRFYSTVPKDVFRAFFKDLGKVMDTFAEMAKVWLGDASGKIKVLAEDMKLVTEAIAAAPTALIAIGKYLGIPETSIIRFFDDLGKLLDRFDVLTESFTKATLKHIRKFAELMKPSVELFAATVSSITGMFDIKEIPAANFDILQNALKEIVRRIGEVSDFFEKQLLKQIGFFGQTIAPAVDLWKSAIDAIKSMVDVPVPTATDFNNLFNSIKAALFMMSDLAATIDTDMLLRAQSIADISLSIFAAIKAAVESLGELRSYTKIPSETFALLLQDFQLAVNMMISGLAVSEQFVYITKSFEANIIAGAAHLANAVSIFTAAIRNLGFGLARFGITLTLPIPDEGAGVGTTAASGGFAPTSATGGGFTPSSFSGGFASSGGPSAPSSVVTHQQFNVTIDPTRFRSIAHMYEWFRENGENVTELLEREFGGMSARLQQS